MTRRRFFATPDSFQLEEDSVTLSPEETRHLRDVLRLSPGDRASVFDGQGHEYDCVIKEVSREFARLKIVSTIAPNCPESPLNLTMAVALLKGEKFDLVVQKCTELGVRAIVPVITKLADVRLRVDSDALKRQARWQRIALEAAKQSGRAVVPGIATPTDLETLLSSNDKNQQIQLMFTERRGRPFAQAIEKATEAAVVTAVVGSEGGWTDEELNLAEATDWRLVTLGGRILRAETAAITICALLQHRFGDFR